MHIKFHVDSKVDRRDTQTHRQHGDCISLLLFFRNRESGLQPIHNGADDDDDDDDDDDEGDDDKDDSNTSDGKRNYD
jgi:hypothetical protein